MMFFLLLGSVGGFAPQPFGPTSSQLGPKKKVVPKQMSSRLVAPGQKFKQDKRKKIASGKDYLRSMSVFKEALGPVREQMKEDFQSGLVKDLKSSNYILEREGITMYLAKEFGFCWGVERSIELAFAAVEKFPDRKVHIANELIHNPLGNDQLHDKNVNFIEKTGENGGKDFSDIESGDVVMLPAFGASLEELEHFDAQDVKVVDTTCPWVARVWNTVHQHQVRGLTSVIHGKWGHEETIATKSYCEDCCRITSKRASPWLACRRIHKTTAPLSLSLSLGRAVHHREGSKRGKHGHGLHPGERERAIQSGLFGALFARCTRSTQKTPALQPRVCRA